MDIHAMNQTPQFSYLGRLTTVIAASLVQAMALAHEGDFGCEYADAVRRTRELYNELLEELVTTGPSSSEFARGLADSIGVRLDDLERRTTPAVAQVHARSPKPDPLPTNDRAERRTTPAVAQVHARSPKPDPLPTNDRAERRTTPAVAQVHARSPKPDPLPTNDRAELWHLWR
jgi:hypothetical protein